MTDFKSNPMLVQARKFLDELKFEESIELFSTLLQNQVAKYGEDAIECAEAYYEYGNALLSKEEESPDTLLGTETTKANDAAAQELVNQILSENAEDDEEEEHGEGATDDTKKEIDGEEPKQEEEGNDDDGDDDESDDDGEDGDEEDGQGEDDKKDDAEVEDLQVAWELLEVARKIYEANVGPDTDIPLAKVNNRLGDLYRINGLFDEAISEYHKALSTYEAVSKPSSRDISTLHFEIAVAHVYKAGNPEADKVAEKEVALVHYKKARESLQLALDEEQAQGPPTPTDASTTATSSSSSSSSSSATDDARQLKWQQDVEAIRGLVAELSETIEALEAELREGGEGYSIKDAQGVSSIGFGFDTSSSSTSAAGSNFFASAQSSSSSFFTAGASSSSSSSSTSSTLQVKRKSDPKEVMERDSAEKKVKVDGC